jgi:predicted MPP superfamily phosphohydrolase
MDRRKFLRRAAATVAGASLAGAAYTRYEAGWLHIDRQTVSVPRLPNEFAGLTVALLADIHHGPFVSLDYVREVVAATNALAADLIAVPGDFIQHNRNEVRPCFEALSALRAPLGVWAVPGNHDHWQGVKHCHQAMRDFGLIDVTNTGRWLERGAARLRVGGVDDLWNGTQDLDAALGDAGPGETCLLLCHNPDYVESITDDRVGLALCGHLHGGQINLPGVSWQVPSHYGRKYLAGLVRAPHTLAFVTRGVGTIGLPLRFRARPEVNLLTLTPAPG